MSDVIWGICSNLQKWHAPTLPKMALNRQFQAKVLKCKNRNISETINPIKIKIEDQAETSNCTSWVV